MFLFVVLTALTVAARTEYFVLVLAYAASVLWLDRGRTLKEHKVALIAVVPALLAVLVAATGYFSGVFREAFVGLAGLEQIGLQIFLLTLVAGVVIVPGGIIGLWGNKDRAARAFSVFVGWFLVLLISEIGVFSVHTVAKFRERYLFVVLPLVAIGYGLYRRNGRPHRWVMFATAVALAGAAARAPVSTYATGASNFDSETMTAIESLQSHFGAASISFVVAIVFTVGGLLALLFAGRRMSRVAMPIVVAFLLVMTIVATHEDRAATSSVRDFLPADREWVDHAAKDHQVSVIATPLSSPSVLTLLMYWNPAIDRELLLDDANETDSYATEVLDIHHSGRLANASGYVLFDAAGSQATFKNAKLLRTEHNDQLWYSKRDFHLRTLIEGRYPDGWLISGGRVRAWAMTKHHRVRVTFSLSVPPDWPGTAVFHMGGSKWYVHPGASVRVACIARGPRLDLFYHSPSALLTPSGRATSVRLMKLRASDINSPPIRTKRGISICRTAPTSKT